MDERSILAFFREKTSRPLSFREIVSSMALNHKEARALKRFLRTMVRSGDIVMTRRGLYGPTEELNLVNGYFEAHREGYGFVIPEKPAERDIFIPARATSGAMNGDRVIGRIDNARRREGRIVRILERAHTKIAGKFEVTRSGCYVKPKDRSIPFDLMILKKDRGVAKDGETVMVEVTDYPTDRKPPLGKVVKILKKPEDPRLEVETIIDEFDLPQRFPRKVLEGARQLSALRTERITHRGLGRRDLRSLPTVTIDGERAKDFDDAVSIEIAPHGYVLYVHIADVGFYLDWDSEIDIEARSRGTSVYFPDRVIPMLPKELSEDLCSLKPGVERLSFTVEMHFDRNGSRQDANFYPGIIVSDERMTYTSVRKILIDNDGAERDRYKRLLRDFELMAELCGILRSRRLKRGSLDFDLPDPEVLLDLQGRPEAIINAERNFAHMMIEEFMIAANEAVAEFLEGIEVPSLYRIHEEPDPVKFEEIRKVLRSAGIVKQNLKPKDFPEMLQAIKGTNEEEIINYMILRSLKQARYSDINVGHFGLASASYTHFTSPIRRYPDLVVHRILREALKKKSLPEKRVLELRSILPDIAFHSSRMERIAEKAEREVIDAMRAWFMKDKIGEEFAASIVSAGPYGLRIRLKAFFVEGFIHVSNMTDDFYQYDDVKMRLCGRHTKKSFAIGHEIRVRLDKVDMEERELVFDIVRAQAERATGRTTRKREKRGLPE